VPGDLALDCFALAGDVRLLDMQASPYDLTAYGQAPVAIETPEGKAAYAHRQRELARRAAELRGALIAVCEQLERAASEDGALAQASVRALHRTHQLDQQQAEPDGDQHLLDVAGVPQEGPAARRTVGG
jgi:hypothetical protein